MPASQLESHLDDRGSLRLTFRGSLDVGSVGSHWRPALDKLGHSSQPEVIVDCSEVEYCDGAGLGLLFELQRKAKERNLEVRFEGLRAETRQLLARFNPEAIKPVSPAERRSVIQEVGLKTAALLSDMGRQVVFTGEMTSALISAIRRPHQVRWKDALLTAERAGVDALPIVCLVCFLMGLILAFQSAVPMKQFGADVFVGILVSISMVRELGPLMTAILLAGRTGSAFAAELGTMKVNEELDALTTLGLDPVRFLVAPRVIAAVAVTPLLTVIGNLLGLIGGAVVFVSMGYPLIMYWNQFRTSVDMPDLLGGLFKALVFGILVAAVGCLRGLQTKTGASAVGISTTRAVVSGIILIVFADGLFAILYYILGI
jgi:phospholipid/cholesterol/gamma-HCH transport system permease protein